MEKNKIKKLIGVIGLGLAVVLTTAAGLKTVGAMNGNEAVENILVGAGEPDYENFGKHREYGKLMDGTTFTKDMINEWVRKGYISEEQGELDIKFLDATSEEEKEEIYDKIIDVTRGEYGFTDAEVDKLKEAGYKKHDRTVDEIYIQHIVDAGGMSEEDAKIQLMYDSAITEEQKDEVVGLLVDRMVKDGEITKEQGDKIKEEGYDNYHENVWMIRNRGVADELLSVGEITEEKAREYKETDDMEKIQEMYSIYNKYEVKKDLEAGAITEEEASLYNAYYDAATEEDEKKAYGDILDYNVRMGIMTQEEANEGKAYYGI